MEIRFAGGVSASGDGLGLADALLLGETDVLSLDTNDGLALADSDALGLTDGLSLVGVVEGLADELAEVLGETEALVLAEGEIELL